MGKNHGQQDAGDDPSPAEIAGATAEIRAGWSRAEWVKRAPATRQRVVGLQTIVTPKNEIGQPMDSP